ncbi:MAG TPA: alcohol dehydrogenase [Acidobacteria bacterium]|nr:alcohol dehydrogenase [Acidobacteriota bacterium]
MIRVLQVRVGPPSPEAVEVVEVPTPEPGPAQARVRVAVRPIDPADLLLLEGRHLFRPTLPNPIGIEGAGVVEAVGAGSGLAVGDRVALICRGTWCEQLLVTDDDVLQLPEALALDQASMLGVNPFTAAGLLEGLEPGQRVVLNAAGSAVGRMCLALARHRGVQAVAVVRRDRHASALRALGAEAVLVDGPDLAERLRAIGPVHRALDAVAGDASGRLLDALEEGSDLVVYGLLGSDRVDLPAATVVFRDVRITGFSRLRVIRAMPAARRAEVSEELAELAVAGVLAAQIEARYALAEVRAALEHQLRPDRIGKILLTSP